MKYELRIKEEKSKPKKPDLKTAKTVRAPIKISTKKVSLGILLWQYRHLPLSHKKENKGKRSLFLSSVSQEKQIDRPLVQGSPVL